MSITFTPELEAIVREDALRSGFSSPEAYLEACFGDGHEEHMVFNMTAEEIDAAIDEGLAEAENGRMLSPEEAKAQMALWKQEYLQGRDTA